MPNSKEHQDKAKHNRAFLDQIDVQSYPDWAAVVAFYTVVHLIERLRTRLPKTSEQHSQDHQDRLEFVQRHHRPIHTEYHTIFNAALLARYGTVNAFNKQFKWEHIQDILIKQYLSRIEIYVAGQFQSPS